MLAALHELVMASITEQNGDASKTTYDNRNRSVSQAGVRVAYLGKERVIWTTAGKALIPDEARTVIAEVAEGTR